MARSSADWHRLIEICGITRTLLADEAAVYDPRDPNDRLLLGLKGTISEAELFTLRCRLHEGRWNKARRGALTRSLPAGFVMTESGTVVKDPDRSVRAARLPVPSIRSSGCRPQGLVALSGAGADAPHQGLGRPPARTDRLEGGDVSGNRAHPAQPDLCRNVRLWPV